MGLRDANESAGRLSSRRSGRRRIGARVLAVQAVQAAAGLVAAYGGGNHSAAAPA